MTLAEKQCIELAVKQCNGLEMLCHRPETSGFVTAEEQPERAGFVTMNT